MSQARVTDFYFRRRRGGGAPLKAGQQLRGFSVNPPRSPSPEPCSSAVHREFIQVIDEAAGLLDGGSSVNEELPGPRTPKRTSAEAELGLGAAVLSVSAQHSTAKKKRAAEASALRPERTTRRAVRRKLAPTEKSPPAASRASPSEGVFKRPPAVSALQDGPSEGSRDGVQAESAAVNNNEGGSTKVPRGDVSSLKSRLQRIKKQALEMDSAAAPSSPTTAAALPSSGAKALLSRLSRAKELAANAQRRKEEREAQSETPTQSSAELPAYQRYHNLAEAASPGLSLPYTYRVLAERFRSMDTVVAMLYNRSETATFTKIQRGVQDMMHKRFEESHVGQIKSVFPKAYAFRQENNVPTFNSSMKKGAYQLTVEPLILSAQNEARPLLSASRLLERRRLFHLNLVSIVKQHHKVFLSSLAPPLSVPEDKLTRWHPHFSVDTVPPVQPGVLPQAPHTERPATAQEVLDKARALITPKMEKALVSLTLEPKAKEAAQNGESPPVPQTPPAPAAAPAAKLPNTLRGVSQSLLDRIRAKEAQKIRAAMTRDPGQEERLLMMSRLGELARILRSVFVAEKKPALIMEVACNRMVCSYRSALSTGEMEKHIRLLAEVAADWLTVHPIRKDFYVKLNKNMELSVVLDKLSRRLKEEERLQVEVTPT